MKLLEVSDIPFHELRYRSAGRGGEVLEITLPFFTATVDILPEGVSSFVLTSDLQGREIDTKTNRLVGEAVAEELSLLYELEELPYIDLVALAGDLYAYPELHKLGGTGDVTRVWNAFARNFDHVIGVHGNHDKVVDAEMSSNSLVLDGTSSNIKDINFGGVSGIIGRSDKNQRKTKAQFLKELAKITHDRNDIILLHQGPEDETNGQLGDPEITAHLKSNGSGIVVFGHCHWRKPFIEIGKNQVLNVDNRLYVVTAAST